MKTQKILKLLAQGCQLMSPIHQQRQMADVYTKLWLKAQKSTKVMGKLSEAFQSTSSIKPTFKV